MKKYVLLGLSTLLYTHHQWAEPNSLKLESGIVKIMDGTFFTADTVELIRKCQNKNLDMLLGSRTPSGTRVGRYKFRDKHYSIVELREIEQTLESKKNGLRHGDYAQQRKDLQDVLAIAKDDFIVNSEEFKAAVGGAKQSMLVLIKESCSKRNRQESILVKWGSTTLENESELFYKEVTSFAKFEEFMVDLLNFLNDIIHSCPKAFAQFNKRVEKFNRIKTLLPSMKHPKLKDRMVQVSFLKYVKMYHLDKIRIEDIDTHVLSELFMYFSKDKLHE